MGLMILSCPAMSGASRGWARTAPGAVPQAGGTTPMLPVISLASSDRMSPNIFSFTSNWAGSRSSAWRSCHEHLPVFHVRVLRRQAVHHLRHRRLVSSTLALSTR